MPEVLRKHRKLIGQDVVIDEPVKRIDGKVGIVDLMLSRSVPRSRPDEREHLVIELKRPSVKIGRDEIGQIKDYAFAIAEDARFAADRTRWSYWVVSNDLDAFARRDTSQVNMPRGQLYNDGNTETWIKTWGEIIDGCKARMKFVHDHLQANVDRESSLKYLKQTYEKLLTDVAEEYAPDLEEDDEVSAAS